MGLNFANLKKEIILKSENHTYSEGTDVAAIIV